MATVGATTVSLIVTVGVIVTVIVTVAVIVGGGDGGVGVVELSRQHAF